MSEGEGMGAGHRKARGAPVVSPLPEDKAGLEVAKLRAEVEEIHARTKGPAATLARLTGITGLVVTMLSLIAGGVGLYYGYMDFRTRSENEVNRQARQLDFEVGRAIIELSMSLSSSDKTKRTNATILLSAYEEHSVPILLANLRTHDQTLAESVVRSLKLILKKPRIREKPELVKTPLVEEAQAVFAEELQKDAPDTLAMTYFADAFGEIFAGTKDTDVLGLLNRLDDQVVSAEKTVTTTELKDDLRGLLSKVREARRAVKGGS